MRGPGEPDLPWLPWARLTSKYCGPGHLMYVHEESPKQMQDGVGVFLGGR